MTSIETLKQSARAAAKFRRHDTGYFKPNAHRSWAEAACRTCGMCVAVNTRPAPNDINIGGGAVALNCSG